jgi:hypothetical protein
MNMRVASWDSQENTWTACGCRATVESSNSIVARSRSCHQEITASVPEQAVPIAKGLLLNIKAAMFCKNALLSALLSADIKFRATSIGLYDWGGVRSLAMSPLAKRNANLVPVKHYKTMCSPAWSYAKVKHHSGQGLFVAPMHMFSLWSAQGHPAEVC